MLDGATIIESGIDKECSFVIALYADENVRIKRFTMRDNLSEIESKSRASAGKPIEFYKQNSNVLINNDGSVDKLKNEFSKLINNILKGE